MAGILDFLVPDSKAQGVDGPRHKSVQRSLGFGYAVFTYWWFVANKRIQSLYNLYII